MNINARIFFGMLLAGATVTAVACSDSNDTSSSTTTTAATTTTTTSGAGGAGGAAGVDCLAACTNLYNCGLEKDGMAQLCPGFKGGAEKDTFVKGTKDNGCEAQCKDQQALAALVDPMNCKGTIDTLKGLNATFKSTCESGLSSGAGGAGQGGAGGK